MTELVIFFMTVLIIGIGAYLYHQYDKVRSKKYFITFDENQIYSNGNTFDSDLDVVIKYARLIEKPEKKIEISIEDLKA
jgi:hypothetical protein